MWFERIFVLLVVFICKIVHSQDFETSSVTESYSTTSYDYFTEEPTTSFFENDFSSQEDKLAKGEKKISETILEIIEHFKKPNPVGIPGLDISDSYAVPDMKKAVTFFDTLYLENISLCGLSKLKILHVNADFENMKVNAAMLIDKLQAKGTYRYQSLIMPRQGPFIVTITNLKVFPTGNLGVEIDGKVRTQDINVDISFETISVNFENLGAMGNILQGFINTAGHFIFDNIKPHVLQDTYTKARIEIDKKIEEISGDIEFPNTIAPLDMVLIDARKKAIEMGYDPMRAEDYNHTYLEYAFVSLTNTWITGLSSFYRIGNMTLELENNTVVANFEIGTQKLQGATIWDLSIGFIMSTTGTASFSVEYISSRIEIAQPLDTRQKPKLKSFNLDIGNIQARCDGAGTIDYVIEFVVNILPNLLRYQIVGAIEGPLKTRIQEQLNSVDVEEEIKLALPKIDELAESGFKLSSLRSNYDENPTDDEFFNF